MTFSAEDVPLIEDAYVGERYAAPTMPGTRAIQRVAQTEGVLLDPIYTGKAFAGLIDLAAGGTPGRQEPIVFVHTGGAPALFASDQTPMNVVR